MYYDFYKRPYFHEWWIEYTPSPTQGEKTQDAEEHEAEEQSVLEELQQRVAELEAERDALRQRQWDAERKRTQDEIWEQERQFIREIADAPLLLTASRKLRLQDIFHDIIASKERYYQRYYTRRLP